MSSHFVLDASLGPTMTCADDEIRTHACECQGL